MRRSKTLIIIIALIVVAGAICLYYGYLYKSGRNISEEKAAFALTSGAIMADYASGNTTADDKYLNKTIEVKGTVTQISDSVVTLDSAVFCAFDHLPDKGLQNKKVVVKGRCIGYDELFEEVKLDQCSIKE